MSSGFVTESEAAEVRRKRQEEWEKVRTPQEPLERPEEPYDCRSLYEKLKEQKLKKDLEYEEAHKLKNLIRGLDDDEIEFLDLVDRTKMDVEKQHMLEEKRELKEFRARVVTMQEETQDKKIQSELAKSKPKPNTSIIKARPSQKSLLMGVGIKRKNGETISDVSSGSKAPRVQDPISESESQQSSAKTPLDSITTTQFDRGSLKCIAILPGIGPYNESSDSEMSSGSGDEPDMYGYDLMGAKRIKKKTACDEE